MVLIRYREVDLELIGDFESRSPGSYGERSELRRNGLVKIKANGQESIYVAQGLQDLLRRQWVGWYISELGKSAAELE